jgi:hypothetical protein
MRERRQFPPPASPFWRQLLTRHPRPSPAARRWLCRKECSNKEGRRPARKCPSSLALEAGFLLSALHRDRPGRQRPFRRQGAWQALNRENPRPILTRPTPTRARSWNLPQARQRLHSPRQRLGAFRWRCFRRAWRARLPNSSKRRSETGRPISPLDGPPVWLRTPPMRTHCIQTVPERLRIRRAQLGIRLWLEQIRRPGRPRRLLTQPRCLR